MEGEKCQVQASPDSSTQTTSLSLIPNLQLEPPGPGPGATQGPIVQVETTSITATQSSYKRKKKKKIKKRDKTLKKKKLENEKPSSDTCKFKDVQNQTVNSTQESNSAETIEGTGLKRNEKKTGDYNLSPRANNKANIDTQKTTIGNEIGLEQSMDVDTLDSKEFTLDIRPLSDYVFDKKLLYKEVFTVINKKEFKSLLPEGLKKYDPRDVRRWCLAEIESMSRKRLRSIITATSLASSADSESENEIVKDENIQIPDSSRAILDKSSVDEELNQNELNIDENQKLNEGENLKSSKNDGNSRNEDDTDQQLCDFPDQRSDAESNKDKNDGENTDGRSDLSESDNNEDNDTNSNQPVQIAQVPSEQNDYQLFQDIFDTPDQEEIEDLMTIKEKKQICLQSKSGAQSKETSREKPLENNVVAQAEILELELRARVLQSFLRAQEKKQAAEKAIK